MPVDTLIPEPIVEILHGVTVVDPYRWLEDRSSPMTQSWIEDQQERCNDYFSQLPGMDVLRARVRDFLDVETLEQPAKVAGRYFFRRRAKGEEQAALWVRDSGTGDEYILVDPSAQGPFAAVAISRIAENGSVLAYALKHGGERTEEIHFVDVASGRIWDDHLPSGHARGLVFTSDNLGCYYCHESADDASERLPHEIRYHCFGESIDHDMVLFSMPRTERSRMALIADETSIGAVLVHASDPGVHGNATEMQTDFYLASRVNDKLWRTIFAGRTTRCGPFLHHGQLYIVSYVDAPNGQVRELLEDGSEGSIILPEWKAHLGGLRLTGDRLYACYSVDCRMVIHGCSWTGKSLGALPAQPDGTFGLLMAYTNSSDDLFFLHESFSQPPSILEYKQVANAYVPWKLQPKASVEHRYDVQRVSYTSKDGTSIPMWLVGQDKETTTTRPALLTGYGAAGVSMTPRFSVLVAIMLELGCVFALPNIRGGSEFGKEWHEAAQGRNRQIVYDDFLAAAEWLCENDITRPEQLAIFGGSNSGLLVAAAMTQRPELFRAVLCIAPILDMVRYEQFGDARKWRSEHGSAEDPDDFRALYACSPYHRVIDDQSYPATLFVTGDKDAQCDPAHVRKMASRLQNRDAQLNPILVDYSAERGHTPALPLSLRIEALTRRLAFLCHELGIEIPEEGLQ